MEPIHIRRGFTLIELLIIVGIIAALTAIIFTSQSSFNKSLILANTAYDIALALRLAETYGLGNRATAGLSNIGYGLDFNRATPASFIFFADSYPLPSTNPGCHQATDPTAPDAQPGDCAYEAGQDRKITSYTLGNGITVSNFCALPSGGQWACASSGGLSSLDIVFARPNTQAFMSANGAYSTTAPVTAACLTVSSAGGGARYVSVSTSGEITANASSCP